MFNQNFALGHRGSICTTLRPKINSPAWPTGTRQAHTDTVMGPQPGAAAEETDRYGHLQTVGNVAAFTDKETNHQA